MVIVKCDLCGEVVGSEHMEVWHRVTEGIATGKTDVCLKCWNSFTKMKRIPVVEFPNTEAKDHE